MYFAHSLTYRPQCPSSLGNKVHELNLACRANQAASLDWRAALRARKTATLGASLIPWASQSTSCDMWVQYCP